MKVLVIGHAQHGKDTVAEMLGLSFSSSSQKALEIFLFDKLNETRSEDYRTLEEAFEDRHENRELWHNLIAEYNTPDKTKLCRGILKDNDCYVGMRCDKEYEACKHLFDHIFWVDALSRKPRESNNSMKIKYNPKEMKFINNNTTEENLYNIIREIRTIWGT